ADSGAVTVHILGCGMGDYIRSPLEGTAVYRRSKGVVYDKRNPMPVSRSGKALYIKHSESGVCNRFAENSLCVRLKRRIELLVGAVGRDKGKVYSHLLHCNG